MSFQWTFLATFLYCELVVIVILLLPFISPATWHKFFKSRLVKAFSAGAKYYFNFIICVFTLLFLDSIRELNKYSKFTPDISTPHVEAQTHMKQFRSQRNFYIAGFALFLWFVIKRLMGLLSQCAHEMADSVAARKQAESAHRHLEGLTPDDLLTGDKKAGDVSRYIDPKEHDEQLSTLNQGLSKAKADMDALREKYDSSITDYDKLADEHRQLQTRYDSLAREQQELPKDK
ncbi:unnamed protein product [Didymodactylos carnosus]|uniref:Endoplasmic reticulum transmembrane protein n=1 Tax=Didymodactylos carnosus TaxID=1234261 RepID=A0A814LKH2_9BILA|nr:unnamed protein product [Didymodactylos carnosus]CAF1147170.1 unnamed protein product [Didymodactylos carnosus]CAF3833180.1 unnamed protein product [Didymodactylos carnosus]CAF3950107.1 unnamed protein product [Didymodactylos carnosus]